MESGKGKKGGFSMFNDDELSEHGGLEKHDDHVVVTYGCSSKRLGDAMGKLRVFASGELLITYECTPGCPEDPAETERGKEENLFFSSIAQKGLQNMETRVFPLLDVTLLIVSNFMASKALESKEALTFGDNFGIMWSENHFKTSLDGQIWFLSLNQDTGCGLQTKQRYKFGWFSMKLKLLGGDSTSVVTAYYVIAMRDVIPPPIRSTFSDVYIATELMGTDLH